MPLECYLLVHFTWGALTRSIGHHLKPLRWTDCRLYAVFLWHCQKIPIDPTRNPEMIRILKSFHPPISFQKFCVVTLRKDGFGNSALPWQTGGNLLFPTLPIREWSQASFYLCLSFFTATPLCCLRQNVSYYAVGVNTTTKILGIKWHKSCFWPLYYSTLQ